MPPYSVLFVCTGNICRSPTARAVFDRRVVDLGWHDRLTSDSAGTQGYHVGEPPDDRAVEAATNRGYHRISTYRARTVTPDDFRRFDLILGMDREHLNRLQAVAPPDADAELRLFLDYAPETGRLDVPDPYYGETRGFDTVLDLIERGVDGVIAALRPRIEAA